ncbi:hypothetical protein LTR97_008156 [Elasticomyces elasticus]|uniref:Uncharacterized protein n=1 Tax=Elasticomyces elasticus TaxID=574655 RepID=A0AAN7VQR2_9PEZI|nr:hypothetical protein LTR97_008156 [Elasticomyces elasticus]
MLALNASDISTQIHIGGKVGQYGANSYDALRYGDLTGLPPASQYELQQQCLHVGCATIYPSVWSPILAVPTQLRSMDPAWQDCAIGLEGLFDPPVALTPQPVMASATIPAPGPYSTSTAAPQPVPETPGASVTPLSSQYLSTVSTRSSTASSTPDAVHQTDTAELSAYATPATSAFTSITPVDSVDPSTSAGTNALSVLASALDSKASTTSMPLASASTDLDVDPSEDPYAQTTILSVGLTTATNLEPYTDQDSSVLRTHSSASVAGAIPSASRTVVTTISGERQSSLTPYPSRTPESPTSSGLLLVTTTRSGVSEPDSATGASNVEQVDSTESARPSDSQVFAASTPSSAFNSVHETSSLGNLDVTLSEGVALSYTKTSTTAISGFSSASNDALNYPSASSAPVADRQSILSRSLDPTSTTSFVSTHLPEVIDATGIVASTVPGSVGAVPSTISAGGSNRSRDVRELAILAVMMALMRSMG